MSRDEGARLGAALTVAAAAPRRRKAGVGFSADLARQICRRVAAGEAVSAICREPGMPTHGTVARWAKILPAFGRALGRARQAAGWACDTARGTEVCPAAAQEIFARLCDGEPLYRICADPHLPSHSTVYRWRDADGDFDGMIRLAHQIAAERLCELGWEMAMAVTPATAYATKVKLEYLRWMAAVMSPRRHARVKPLEVGEAEGEDGGGRGFTVIVKRYTDAPDPEAGKFEEIE